MRHRSNVLNLLQMFCHLLLLLLPTSHALFKKKQQHGRHKAINLQTTTLEEAKLLLDQHLHGRPNESPRERKRREREEASLQRQQSKLERRQNRDKYRRPQNQKVLRGRLGLPRTRRKKAGLNAVLFPGVSPEDFTQGEELPIWVDLVESKKTHLPYEYYDLPMCHGPTVDRAHRFRKTLGAKLQGHNLQASPYPLFAKRNVPCTVLCAASMSYSKALWLRKLVELQYRVHMTLDGLPVVTRRRDVATGQEFVQRGFPLGFKALPQYTGLKHTEYYLYNHVRFVIKYRETRELEEEVEDADLIRIVGFEVETASVRHQTKDNGGGQDDDAQYAVVDDDATDDDAVADDDDAADDDAQDDDDAAEGTNAVVQDDDVQDDDAADDDAQDDDAQDDDARDDDDQLENALLDAAVMVEAAESQAQAQKENRRHLQSTHDQPPTSSKYSTCNRMTSPFDMLHNPAMVHHSTTTNSQHGNNPHAAPPLVPPSALKTLLPITVSPEQAFEVLYSYEVQWVHSDIDWADRFDVYLAGTAVGDGFHLFSLINSCVILLFLTGTVGMIVLRTVRKDIRRYNQLIDTGGSSSLEEEEEGGWKLLHSDVFRPPRTYPSLLCIAVGTGMQLGAASVGTICLALFGFLTPMKKGQMLTTIIVLFVLCGSVAGYVSARLYKYFVGGKTEKKWFRHALSTACAFPCVLSGMFLSLDVFLSFAGAATAVSLWTILSLVLLWLCVSAPLVLVGSFFGTRVDIVEVPTKTHHISRVIPPQKWYLTPPWSVFIAGFVPFGSVSVEFYFIMGALWLHQMYYVMGFLLCVVLILAASCAEMSIIMCYAHLCAEQYEWWWLSFAHSAGAGVWLFLYAVWFLSTNLRLVGVLPTVVYLTYMGMVSVSFGLVCGGVGCLATFWFTRRIYGALKVD